jgi:hypothetical protein
MNCFTNAFGWQPAVRSSDSFMIPSWHCFKLFSFFA